MSSNIRVKKTCKHCGKEFTAKTTITRYCSHACGKQAYYEKTKNEKLNRKKRASYSIEELNKKEVLTVRETARILECSTKTVYRLIEKGTIKAVNLSDRMTRIKKEELNKVLEPKPTYDLENIDLSKYYTLIEIKDRYSISDKALYQIIKREGIEKVKIGSRVYIPKQPIDHIF